MSDETETKSGRVTNHDIDRRVGRLEVVAQDHTDELHQMRNDLAVVKLQGEHNHTLITAKFEQMFANQQADRLIMERLAEKFEQNYHKTIAAFNNPEESPAGKQLLEAIKSNAAESKKTRDLMGKIGGGLAVLIAIATILGPPLVQSVLKLPN